MQSKAADERRRQIVERVRAAGRISVTDVAEQLDVAPETVRNDLLPPLGRLYRAIPSFRTAADEAWPATFVIVLIVAALNLVMIVGYASSRNRRST